MLNEFKDIIDPKMLPNRRKYLHYYIVGLVDGEGCFSISIKKQDNTKFGWVIDPVFHVTQNKEHAAVLEILKRDPNRKWKTEELCLELRLLPSTIRSALRILEKSHLVRMIRIGKSVLYALVAG